MSGVEDLSGTVLEGYQLEDRLGGTSHSAVYLTSSLRGVRSAVKVVDSQLESPDALSERLRQDAAALSELDQPAIVPLQDVGRSGTMTFAAAPFIRAHNLQRLMARGRMDNERAWRILSTIANALDAVHSRGLVYRALKPGNVLIDGEGAVRLVEFGVAGKRVGPLALAEPMYHLSAPQYLAPEQVEGAEPDFRADIYALGVLVFEILTATSVPGSRQPGEALRATLSAPPPSAHAVQPALPRALDGVLGRAMAKDPLARHGSANELLRELVALPDERAPGARPTGPALAVTDVAEVPAKPFSGKLPIPDDSMLLQLKRMGLPVFEGTRADVLGAYFAALMRQAREACGPRWPAVLEASGLGEYPEEDPPEGDRSAAVLDVSRLAGAFEEVYGLEAPDVLRQWGRLTTTYWIKKSQSRQDGGMTYLMPIRVMARPEQKVEDVLSIFARHMDRIRGERLTAWKKVDKRQFWAVLYDNMTVVGRRRPDRSCHFWIAALESTLRWGGLASDWVVEEAECGCVTGTYDCAFMIQHVDS